MCSGHHIDSRCRRHGRLGQCRKRKDNEVANVDQDVQHYDDTKPAKESTRNRPPGIANLLSEVESAGPPVVREEHGLEGKHEGHAEKCVPVGMTGGGPATPDRCRAAATKHATNRTRKASALSTLVAPCIQSLHRTPRHSRTVRKARITTARGTACDPSTGARDVRDPATTIVSAAALPHCAAQSVHPTMKPAYVPIAWRVYAYWAPSRGSIAPSSARPFAASNEYTPPTSHTAVIRPRAGSRAAISPGVRISRRPLCCQR